MTSPTTRRRFIEIVPFAGVALMAACSPKSEPPAPVISTAPPSPPATPMPTPAPAPAAASEAAPTAAEAKNLPMVDEKDAQALALGYVTNASRADKVKYKNFQAGSQCSTCALYLGKAGDAAGPCPLFPGKHVASGGWCSSWVKKA